MINQGEVEAIETIKKKRSEVNEWEHVHAEMGSRFK